MNFEKKKQLKNEHNPFIIKFSQFLIRKKSKTNLKISTNFSTQ